MPFGLLERYLQTYIGYELQGDQRMCLWSEIKFGGLSRELLVIDINSVHNFQFKQLDPGQIYDDVSIPHVLWLTDLLVQVEGKCTCGER